MKTVNKFQLLEELESRVERHLTAAIGSFGSLDDATLNRPAADGGWSMAQCLEHLNTYGRYYLPQIRQRLDQSPARPDAHSFRSTRLGHYFTRLMDPQTGKRKYKAFKSHVPAQSLDAPAVVAEFIRQQEVLLSCLKQSRQADLDAIRIPTSITKWVRLKLGDVFGFVIAHNERHLVQAKRNLPPSLIRETAEAAPMNLGR